MKNETLHVNAKELADKLEAYMPGAQVQDVLKSLGVEQYEVGLYDDQNTLVWVDKHGTMWRLGEIVHQLPKSPRTLKPVHTGPLHVPNTWDQTKEDGVPAWEHLSDDMQLSLIQAVNHGRVTPQPYRDDFDL